MKGDDKGFVCLEIGAGQLYIFNDGSFQTSLYGFTDGDTIQLPDDHTHFGVVLSGRIQLIGAGRIRSLEARDYFSTIDATTIESAGVGIAISVSGYRGMNTFGGPIEDEGRLRYIDGCTDTLLVAPVRKGDPCLNLLHFPAGIVQTPHTHPSVRMGIILKGAGECIVSDKVVPLRAGHAFVIKTETLHSFNTSDSSMDVIAFHPDSDVGMTDDDHPMINRTIVEGVSARFRSEIRTRLT